MRTQFIYVSLVLTFFFSLFTSCPYNEVLVSTVKGTIVDAGTGNPIADVVVDFCGYDECFDSTSSDVSGDFIYTKVSSSVVYPGRYIEYAAYIQRISFSHDLYNTKSIDKDIYIHRGEYDLGVIELDRK